MGIRVPDNIRRPLTVALAVVVALAALGGFALAQRVNRTAELVVSEEAPADPLAAPPEESPTPAPSPASPSPTSTPTPTSSPSASQPPTPLAEPNSTSSAEETVSEAPAAPEPSPSSEPESAPPPPAESHPLTITTQRLGSYLRVFISGTGCSGPGYDVFLRYHDEPGKYGSFDAGLAPPDGTWQLEESLGPDYPVGTYTFEAFCNNGTTRQRVFAYDPQTLDWTG